MDKGSVVRLVLLVLAWLNTFLAANGHKTIPVLDETQVALVVTAVVSVWGFVKHNFLKKQ
jgi:SPP1 family holin